MFKSLVRTSHKWAQKTALAYRASREGIAAIEFAFVAPIMILMYLGLAELSFLIAEDRRVSHAANVAGDLTTQQATITKDDMSNIMNAVLLTLEIPANDPDRDRVKVEITSYVLGPTAQPFIIGQATLGGPFGDTYNAGNIDSRLLNPTSGVVVARVSYDYAFSLMTYNEDTHRQDPLTKTSKVATLTDTFLLKPRTANQVIFDVGSAGGSTAYDCAYAANGRPVC